MKTAYVWTMFTLIQCAGLIFMLIGHLFFGEHWKLLWSLYVFQAIGCIMICVDKIFEIRRYKRIDN